MQQVKGIVLVEAAVGSTKAVHAALGKLNSSHAKISVVDAVTGPFDLIVQIIADDLDLLAKCITEEIQRITGVRGTTTCLTISFG